MIKRRSPMLDREWLTNQYINLGKTRKEIAEATGLTAGRVGNLLQEYQIKRYSIERHGLSTHPLNVIWCGMKERCYNPNAVNYQWYGAKGIVVCDDWLTFTNFYNWAVSMGWKQGMTIDRVDCDKNYCPENCRLLTAKQQCRNRKSNVYITVDDETHLQCEWEEIFGLRPKIIAKWKQRHGIDYVINRIKEIKK